MIQNLFNILFTKVLLSFEQLGSAVLQVDTVELMQSHVKRIVTALVTHCIME